MLPTMEAPDHRSPPSGEIKLGCSRFLNPHIKRTRSCSANLPQTETGARLRSPGDTDTVCPLGRGGAQARPRGSCLPGRG